MGDSGLIQGQYIHLCTVHYNPLPFLHKTSMSRLEEGTIESCCQDSEKWEMSTLGRGSWVENG